MNVAIECSDEKRRCQSSCRSSLSLPVLFGQPPDKESLKGYTCNQRSHSTRISPTIDNSYNVSGRRNTIQARSRQAHRTHTALSAYISGLLFPWHFQELADLPRQPCPVYLRSPLYRILFREPHSLSGYCVIFPFKEPCSVPFAKHGIIAVKLCDTTMETAIVKMRTPSKWLLIVMISSVYFSSWIYFPVPSSNSTSRQPDDLGLYLILPTGSVLTSSLIASRGFNVDAFTVYRHGEHTVGCIVITTVTHRIKVYELGIYNMLVLFKKFLELLGIGSGGVLFRC